MTHPNIPPQQSRSADSSIAGQSEDSDSPADMPDPYVEWISPAQNQVENNIAEMGWHTLLDIGKPLCLTLLDKFAKQNEIPPFSVSVLWTNDSEIAEINQQFRQKNGATNILSFPASDSLPDAPLSEPFFLGDMALSFETLTREAAQNRQPSAHHMAHLFLHGLLHLAGYDHQDDLSAEEMEALEIQLLSEINIPNPYLLASDRKRDDKDDV